MRVLFGALAIFEICLAAAPFISLGINRPEASRAWYAWRQNPTPAAEQAWTAEKARLKRETEIVDYTLVGLLLFNSICLLVVGRKILHKSRAPHQPASRI